MCCTYFKYIFEPLKQLKIWTGNGGEREKGNDTQQMEGDGITLHTVAILSRYVEIEIYKETEKADGHTSLTYKYYVKFLWQHF